MEQMAIEYLANAFWQLPLLAAGAWLLQRLWKPNPAAQHRIWLGVLALGLLMPLRGIAPAPASSQPAVEAYAPTVPAAVASIPPDTSNTMRAAQGTPPEASAGTTSATFPALLHRIRLSATAVAYILALWLAAALWGVIRLLLAWTAARRLVRTSRHVVLAGHEAAEVLDCARHLGVRMPDLRESRAIAGPVVVGAIRPILLWPYDFRRHSSDELKAALCHEIAHIRRRDYAMNLICEAAALPLKWHPTIRSVERRIRATREMACDDMAAKAMNSKTLYATCLLSLAQSMVGAPAQHSLAAGLFNGNVMEERVMQLTRNNTPATWRWRTRLFRGAAGAAAIAASIALAAAFHVVPAMAQTQGQANAPVIKIRPVVPVNPAVNPIVNLTIETPKVTLRALPPRVNLAEVKPVINLTDVTPVVHFSSHVMVHIEPVLNPVFHFSQVEPIIHLAPIAPIIQVVPAPPPAIAPVPAQKSVPATRSSNHSQNENLNERGRNLTPAERAQIERQLQDAQRRVTAAKARVDSPEFRKQIEDAQAKALQAETMLSSAQFKKQMADAQRQVAEATAKFNSPEFKQRIQSEIDAASKLNSLEFQKQMEDAQAAALKAQTMFNSDRFRKQMAEAQEQVAAATAQINSPEFKKQIEDQVRAAQKINSAEIQKQMADAQKQIADALAKMKAEQKAEVPK